MTDKMGDSHADFHKIKPIPNHEKDRNIMKKIHPDLKGKVWVNCYIGAPIFGLIAIGIFCATAHSIMSAISPLPGLILMIPVGILFLWAAVYIWRSAKWYECISAVLKETASVSAKLHFRRNKAGSPVVTLIPLDQNDFSELQIVCCDTKWDFNKLEDTIVHVHIDPEPGGSAIINTPFGLVWPLERQRVNRIKRYF